MHPAEDQALRGQAELALKAARQAVTRPTPTRLARAIVAIEQLEVALYEEDADFMQFQLDRAIGTLGLLSHDLERWAVRHGQKPVAPYTGLIWIDPAAQVIEQLESRIQDWWQCLYPEADAEDDPT